MADGVFNIAKGAFAEMFRDSAAKGILLLLTTSEAAAALVDYDDLAAMLAGAPVEAVDASYARKTGITGTITVDDTNDRVDVDIPNQTFSALDGAAIVAAIFAYENAAADATRVPLSYHDIAITPDASDVTIEINASGIVRSA